MHIKRRDLFITISLLIALGITASLIKWQAESAQQHQQKDALAAQRSALKERIEKGLYVAEPGERADGEASTLLMMEEYWGTRIGYPTGNFDFKWIQAAARQDQAIPAAVPAGRVTYSPNNDAPVVLDPNRWTSIGPRPQNSNTCAAPCFVFNTVAGRVNDIVIDPTMPNVAYLAPDGGAVWRTTNCCSPATTWMTTTAESPLINGTAIGDLSVDRNNGYVYAGTGDLRFGSFSFGSAGLLKSTDRGLTWQVKGEDVFGPYYPEGVGEFPQYNSIGKVEPDPANSNTLIVGAKPGVYMSYNGGDNWVGPCLPDPFPQQRQDITALVVHTNTVGLSTMFVAVGGRGISTTVQSNLGDNGANGIYKASVPTGGGCPANWQLVSRPDNGWPMGTGSGIPRHQGGNPVGRIDLAMSPSDPNYIYAQVQAVDTQASCAGAPGCQLGIWRTTNGGTTWQQMSNGDTLNQYGDECGPVCLAIPDVCGDYPQNWYDQNIIVHPTQPDTIFFQNHNIWRSTDGGATMQDLTCGYGYLDTPPPPGVHVDNHAMAFVPGDATGNSLMAGSDGGAYISLNAMSPQPVFANLNNTLSTIEFYSGDITQNFATNPNPAAVAGAQDNGSSIWQGDPTIGPYVWNQRLGGDGMYARIDPVTEGVYMESQNGNLNFLGPRASGQPVAVRGGWASDTLSFVFPYEIYKGVPAGTPGGGEDDCLPAGCKHMIAGSNRVWETIAGGLPNGSSWYANSPNLTKNTLGNRSFINQLAYAPRTDDYAIVGTNDGNVQIGLNMGTGVANTATWRNVTGGNAVLPNRPILDVVFDEAVLPITPTLVLTGYAAVGGFDQNTPSTPGHVFQVVCTLNCTSFTWANKTGNLPNIPVDSIMVNPRYPGQVFAGTDWGVYVTNNINVASPQWIRFNAGMPNVMIWDMAIDRGFTTLAAFTRSRGAFVWPLPSAPLVGTPEPTATGTQVINTPVVPNTHTPAPPVPTNTPTRTFTPGPTSTPLGCGGTVRFQETFESGTLGQFITDTVSGDLPWRPDNTTRHTGIWSAHIRNNGTIADQRLAMQNAVAIPTAATNAFMQFWHKHRFEDDTVPFDGGVVEYSTDNGTTWVDAGMLMIEGQYNGVILAGADNPLGGRQGYTNRSPAWPNFNRVTLSLNTLRGQSVKFRFRHGADQNTGLEGWWVDDVTIITQEACATVSVTPGGSTPTVTRTSITMTPMTSTPTVTPGGPTSTATRTAVTGSPTATVAGGSPTATACSISFTDVPSTHTFYAEIRCLACRGIVSGYADGKFRPDNLVTRSQLAKIVSNAANLTDNPGPQIFQDVPPGHPFYDWINRLTMRGHMTGYNCGSPGEPCVNNRAYFRPYNNATRAQTSKIVANAAMLSDTPRGQTFQDVPSDHPFYVWIERLASRGVMGGYQCGGPNEPCVPPGNRAYFRPYNDVTRGQAAKIVANTFFPGCPTP